MPTTLKEDAVQYVSDLYNAVKQWRDPQETRWKRFYKLYRNYRTVSDTPYKSNIFVPYVFSKVETVVPKMLGTMFNTRPIISVQARKGATEDMASLLEVLLEYQLDEDQLEFFSKILEFFKECAVYGSSFAKIIPKFNDDDLASFNYIDVEPIDLFHIFPDYRAKSIRRMKYIIQLSYTDYDDLERMARAGFYQNVKELLGKLESMSSVDEYKKKRLTSVGILDEYGFDSNRRVVEVLEYWDRENIYTIGARREILKKEKNPFGGLLPFIMARYVPVQHELYGIGIPEIAESLQEELNDVRNQRMDNVNLIINRMFIANKYADIDFDSLVSYPGNVILASDVNAIKDLTTPDVTQSAYKEEEIIKSDIDTATGEYPYDAGAPPMRRETATGIVKLQQASNIRFDTVVKMLEFTVLRSIAKTFLWLDYHFLEPEEFARIVGKEEYAKRNGDAFYQQDITEILKQYNFQPMGSSITAVKEVRTQQMMQAYQLFNQDPYINQLELRKMLLDAFDIKCTSKLLQTPPIPAASITNVMPQPGEQPGQGPPGAPPPGQGPPGAMPPGPPGAMPPPPPPPPGQGAPNEADMMAMLMQGAGGAATPGPPGIPGRAYGGPVEEGQPVWVGERGPELYIPEQSGYVVPMEDYYSRHGRAEVYQKEGVPEPLPREEIDTSQWPLRQDGTKKGYGWLGTLPTANGGVASELTAGVSFGGGKEELIPSMVPTLSPSEVKYLLNQEKLSPELWKTPIGQSIFKKAVEHAIERKKAGKSPFVD